MRIYIETFGCQMNRLDSELVAAALRAAGHELAESARSADVLLYNTCSVRQHAEDKVHSRIGAAEQRKTDGLRNPAGEGKSKGGKLIIGVMGCMAQRLGRELLELHPGLDIVCGPGQLTHLAEMIESAAAGAPAVALDASRRTRHDAGGSDAGAEASNDDSLESLDLGRDPAMGGSPAQAYIRVARGCDKFCAYCIVPTVRGPEVCRNPSHVVDEARRLVNAGRTEITLLGQTVNSYLWRAGETTVRFSDLLSRVAAVPGLHRLRFVTSHPIDFGDDMLQAMRDLPNICRYIHCPAQSGSDAVLKRMRRRYTRAQYDDLIDRARAIVPGVSLAGDFIVGFPGETEADHAASAELIRRSGYRNSFIFKYSPRPGTTAAKLTDDVTDAVKRRRNRELLEAQDEAGLKHHAGYVDQTVEVLVEGPSRCASRQPTPTPTGRTQMMGRTRGDHIVVFDGHESLAGQYVNVRITSASALTLTGKIND